MLKKMKMFGIIVMVAIIGFSMVACSSLDGIGAAIGSGSSGSGVGASVGASAGASAGGVAWPTDDVWAGYGLSGLQPPPGKETFAVNTVIGMYMVGMAGEDRAAYDNLVAQIRGTSGVTEAVAEQTDRDGRRIGFTTSTGNVVIVMLATGSDGSVSVSIQR